MNYKKSLTIKEFSRLSGFSKDSLRFYDQIGLLKPDSRGENNYRYYSRHQLNEAYLISGLRGLGVDLETIRQYATNRTPQKMLDLFAFQSIQIRKEIERLEELDMIMQQSTHMTKEALIHQDHEPYLEERKREPLFLCPLLPDGMDEETAIVEAYDYATLRGVNAGFPFGAVLSKSVFQEKKIGFKRFYIKAQVHRNAWKPAGLYVVMYAKNDDDIFEIVREKITAFVKKQNLEIIGDSFAENPLDELAVESKDDQRFCIQVPVRKKD